MSEVTKYGGGTEGPRVEDDIDKRMLEEMNQAQSDYQMAWIKNMNARLVAAGW